MSNGDERHQRAIVSSLTSALLQKETRPEDFISKFRNQSNPMNDSNIGCVLFHNSHVLAVNRAWSLCWGYAEEEVKGCTLKLLQGPESHTQELKAFEDQLRKRPKSLSRAKLVNYTKSGVPVPVLVHAHPIGKEHYVSFMVLDCNDNEKTNLLHQRSVRRQAVLSKTSRRGHLPEKADENAIAVPLCREQCLIQRLPLLLCL